jgi:hypothetical protein
MKRRTLLAVFACGLGWSLVTTTFAQVDPQQCIEGTECCVVAPCCSATAGYCSGTCSCSHSCGPGGGSCSCDCDSGSEFSVQSCSDKDAGLPPVSLEASFTVNYDRGFASLDEVARTIRSASRWTIDVPTELDALPINGKWEGTFVEVIKQIAKEASVEVTIDTDQRKVVFGLSR